MVWACGIGHPAQGQAVKIEIARPDDAAELASLARRIFTRPDHGQSWPEEEWRNSLRQPGCIALFARDGAGTSQGLALARVAHDEADLYFIGLSASFRGQGWGRILLVALMEEVKKHGASHMVLEVAESNAAARELYTAMKFEIVGRRPRYYSQGASAEDALLMRAMI